MGKLEDGLGRKKWPPLVREVIQTRDYPGYRYEFFNTFDDLDKYFSNLCGQNWRSQDWAKFWLNQHARAKYEDRREDDVKFKGFAGMRKNRGPRNDMESVVEAAISIITDNPNISSRKLARQLQDLNITITQATAWRIIKQFRAKHDQRNLQDTE